MRETTIPLVGIGVLALALHACGQECIGVPSCAPAPPAVTIRVSALNGAPVGGAVAEVSSPFNATVLCNTEAGRTMCDVFGGRGTYTIQVSAAGYQSVQRQVQVGELTERCSCPTLLTQHLDVVLPSDQ
jgi:hypothetical protein